MERTFRLFMIALAFVSGIFTVHAQNGLYGLASSGGKFNVGTVFSTDTNGLYNVKHDLFRIDGSNPHGELIEASNGKLYGTTPLGGANSLGLIFQYDPTNESYKKVHDMESGTGGTPYCTLIEPVAGTLYGTSSKGGANNAGVLFSYDLSSSTYTVIHDFDITNGDEPWGGVIYFGGSLYGMTRYGGANNKGVLYKFELVSSIYTNLFEFSTTKGSWPLGELHRSGNILYGATLGGGDYNTGTFFKFDLTSGIQTPLHHLDNNSGKQPFKGVIDGNDGHFYGLTSSGGTGNSGTLYKWDTDLDTLIVVKHLGVTSGRNPLGILHLADNGLIYGTTQLGGTNNGGTLFSYDVNTLNYSVLKNFDNSTGYRPWGGVVQSNSGELYCLTFSGGENNSGSLGNFDINSSTWSTKLHLNTSNGAYPSGSLIVASDLKMYGLTPIGGLFNLGVIFSYDPLTNQYTVLHDFDQLEGAVPYGSLVEGADNKLYGMTSAGGVDGVGIIFSFDPVTNTFIKKLDLTVTNGSEPQGGMILASNGLMYGMMTKGGSGNRGVLFSYDPNSNTYTKIITFTDLGGKNPEGDLFEATDGMLYGMTISGGVSDLGTLFRFDPNTNTYTKLLDFSTGIGSEPIGGLVQGEDGLLYGMTSDGGAFLFGTIFSYDLNSSTLNTVHDFDQANGEGPNGSLIAMPNGSMFGTTLRGGTHSKGTLFKFWPESNLFFKIKDLNDNNGIFPFGDLVYFEEPGLELDVKVFLEGPYNSLSNQMDDDLRSSGYIPSTEPFTALGFSHAGNGGGETIDPSILNITGSDAIVDWIFVELRDMNDNTSVLSTRSALVQRDGDIVDVDGTSELVFDEDADDYFVAVRHRNHLGVMTLAPVSLSGAPTTIDFTSGVTNTYGTEAQNDVSGTKVMWMGNTFFDNEVKYTGLNNDRDPVLVAIGGSIPTATINGYYSEDCNLDGVVKYTGLNNDRDPILVNIGGSIPTNTRQEQLP